MGALRMRAIGVVARRQRLCYLPLLCRWEAEVAVKMEEVLNEWRESGVSGLSVGEEDATLVLGCTSHGRLTWLGVLISVRDSGSTTRMKL